MILRLWDKKYKRIPDLLVIEGPLAGGHLGFSPESLKHIDMDAYDREITDIIATARDYGEKYGKKIPVAVAGGIDSAKKVNHYLDLGADGVQVATRFVTTWNVMPLWLTSRPISMPLRKIYAL